MRSHVTSDSHGLRARRTNGQLRSEAEWPAALGSQMTRPNGLLRSQDLAGQTVKPNGQAKRPGQTARPNGQAKRPVAHRSNGLLRTGQTARCSAAERPAIHRSNDLIHSQAEQSVFRPNRIGSLYSNDGLTSVLSRVCFCEALCSPNFTRFTARS